METGVEQHWCRCFRCEKPRKRSYSYLLTSACEGYACIRSWNESHIGLKLGLGWQSISAFSLLGSRWAKSMLLTSTQMHICLLVCGGMSALDSETCNGSWYCRCISWTMIYGQWRHIQIRWLMTLSLLRRHDLWMPGSKRWHQSRCLVHCAPFWRLH